MLKSIIDNVEKVIIGKKEVIEKVLIALLCNGHLLIEDVPGTGKTTLAKAIAQSINCSFKRIQFTPDLLPSDIIGLTIYNQKDNTFEFQQGPISSNMVLADEINRTSPKTQSSLLEAMAERQITVDGTVYMLPEPFMVMGTQNPIEYEGTFPLPEAQLDRFMLKISIGYPSYADEKRIMRQTHNINPLASLGAVVGIEDVLALRRAVEDVYFAEALDQYILNLVKETRQHKSISLGVSPRGTKDLFAAAQGHAFIKGRDYVLPDDVKEMVGPVFSHRIKLRPEARLQGLKPEAVLQDILRSLPVPVVKDIAYRKR